MSRSGWFKRLFGIDETSYLQVQRAFRMNGTQLHCNDKKWEVGRFTTPSVKQVREAALALAAEKGAEACAKIAPKWTVEHITTTDVMNLHGLPENKHAVFQAASQFNCLEFCSPAVVPEQGIEGYASDPTQGPACAIACAPGTLYRNYFTPLAGGTGQQRDRQINNLEELEALAAEKSGQTSPFWRVKNGYTESSKEKLTAFNQLLSSDQLSAAEAIDAIRLGVQEDTEVVFSGRHGGQLVDLPSASSENPHVVTQVYCSAISIGYSQLRDEYWAPLARLVLDASYEATLWQGVLSALRHGNNRVFLTFVGGGVFQNKMEWIEASINRAIRVVRAAQPAVNLHILVTHFRVVNPSVAHAIPAE